MVDTEYVTIRLPRGLTDRIDGLVELREEGLRSRAEFVTEAVRKALKDSENEVMKRASFQSWLEQQSKGRRSKS